MSEPKDPQTVIKPAVDGTLAVLEAAKKHKVKRVVITSTLGTIAHKLPQNKKEVYNEEDYSDFESGNAYIKSKILAEKAAWDFIEKLPEDEKFEIVTLHPAFISGPHLGSSDFTSAKGIRMMMTGKMPGVPKIQMGISDVRDLAQAHINAVFAEGAKNQRIIVAGENVWMKEIAEVLKEEFPKHKIKTGEFKYCTVWMLSFFNKDL